MRHAALLAFVTAAAFGGPNVPATGGVLVPAGRMPTKGEMEMLGLWSGPGRVGRSGRARGTLRRVRRGRSKAQRVARSRRRRRVG